MEQDADIETKCKMQKSNCKILIGLLSLTIFLSFLVLPSIPQTQFPKPVGHVNDFANIIPNDIEQKIEALCLEVRQKTGAQIAVATVETIGDEDYNEYANKLFHAWGIGEKGKDNGVLLFNAVKERKFRMEVGYGLEGIIPDGLAGEIRDKYVFPYFRKDDYGNGYLAGTQAVAGIIAEDAGVEIAGITGFHAPTTSVQRLQQRLRQEGSRQKDALALLGFLFIFIIPLLLFIFWVFKSGGLVSFGGGGGSSWSSWDSGGGSSGFSGGFDSFGGGDSGGGGAGGDY